MKITAMDGKMRGFLTEVVFGLGGTVLRYHELIVEMFNRSEGMSGVIHPYKVGTEELYFNKI